MKQLKATFFGTTRGLNSRGFYINLADNGEPDQITFTDLIDTTLTKKVGSNYQDQASFTDIINKLDGDKFVNPASLPDVILAGGSILTLSASTPDAVTPRRVYTLNAPLANNAAILARTATTFTTPANMPIVDASATVGNVAVITPNTTSGVTTYSIYVPATAVGNFVQKTGDTMTGILTFDNGSGGTANIFATQFEFIDSTYTIQYITGQLAVVNTVTGEFVQLDASTIAGGGNVFASIHRGNYIWLDNGATALSDTITTHSRIYATGGTLRYRKVSQGFESSIVFSASTNRTYTLQDGSGTFAFTSDIKLSGLAAATASNTISNSAFKQEWRWTFNAPGDLGFVISESAPSTGGVGNQSLVQITTQATSTANPLLVRARGLNSIKVDSTGSMTLSDAGLETLLNGGLEFLMYVEAASGTLNNYSATGSTYFRFIGSPVTITGFVAPTNSKLIIITNAGGAPMTLSEENVSSTAANRIATPTGIGDITVAIGQTVMLIYDTSGARWRTMN